MKLTPEFMDIFGILAFVIILVIGLLIKFKRRKLSNNSLDYLAIVLIIIGILGLIVDLIIVISNFILS